MDGCVVLEEIDQWRSTGPHHDVAGHIECRSDGIRFPAEHRSKVAADEGISCTCGIDGGHSNGRVMGPVRPVPGSGSASPIGDADDLACRWAVRVDLVGFLPVHERYVDECEE